MSAENVEIVRHGWEHFLATGEPLEDIMPAEFVWDMSTFRGWPEQQHYHGPAGVRAFLDEWTGAFDEWEIELEEMHDTGDKVVCICRQRGRAKLTGASVDMLLAQVFTLRDGLQTRMEMYADPAEALDAVGLKG